MIDMEAALFSEIAEKAKEAFPTLFLTGEYVKSPPSFPCASLIEIDNTTVESTRTTAGERHAAVTYELNVYSNRKSGKKSECRKIAAYLDGLLLGRNFTRILLGPISDGGDSTGGAAIYRMLGRYRAVIAKDKTIYRR